MRAMAANILAIHLQYAFTLMFYATIFMVSSYSSDLFIITVLPFVCISFTISIFYVWYVLLPSHDFQCFMHMVE